MKHKLKHLFFLIFLLFSTSSYCDEIIFDQALLNLDPFISTFEDVNSDYNANSVLSQSFTPQTEKQQSNFGYSSSSHWVRVEIKSPKTKKVFLEIANPRLDTLDFYLYESNQLIKQINTGDQQPFSSRPIAHHNFIFPFVLEANKSYRVLIKVKAIENLFLPIRLWKETAFYQQQAISSFVFGFFYGTLCLIVMINLLIYINLNDKQYLLLSLFIIFFGFNLFVINGLANRFLWGDHIWWAKHSLTFFQSIALFFGLFFTRSFLETKIHVPRIDQYLSGLIGFAVFTALLSLLAEYKWSLFIMSKLSVIVPIIIFYTAYRCLRNGYLPARYFLIAWHIFLIAMISYGLMLQKWLPSNMYTQYGMHAGLIWVSVWLYLALLYRFNLLKQQKEDAQFNTINQHIYTLNYQKRIMKSISRFVPNQFLKLLDKVDITDIKYGDAKLKNMTIMFADIRNYTTISEAMKPEENLEFLNSYMKFMQPVIERNHGFIDKFIGDGIMALFSETADHALQAAIEMQQQLTLFNAECQKNNKTEIKIGIGIHGGDVMLGTVGSDDRLDTTVIGNAVNLTSRLEGMTKQLGISIIISRYTYESLVNPGYFSITRLKDVIIRGKSESVEIYQVLVPEIGKE